MATSPPTSMFARPNTAFLIAHLTDLQSDNTPAFEHAVALALRAEAAVVSLHASEAYDLDRAMPDPAALLRHWGREREQLHHQAIVHRCCDSPVDTILDAFGVLRPDLVVACTHRATGMGRVFRGSVSESVARNAAAPALLIGTRDRGMVTADGRLRLGRVLVPAPDGPSEADAVSRLNVFLDRFAPGISVELILLQVCDCLPESGNPPVGLRPGDRFRRCHDHGDIERAIVRAAHDRDVDIVAMVSRGHDSFGDAVRGSVTERVLRGLDRPLLAFQAR